MFQKELSHGHSDNHNWKCIQNFYSSSEYEYMMQRGRFEVFILARTTEK